MFKTILKSIKSLFIFAINTILSFLILVVLYVVLAFLFTLIPSNVDSLQPKEGIAIYIKSNGVHTDLILPMENKFYNWHERISFEDFAPDTTAYTWAAFGWGNKEFYLNTPRWEDLKVSTAINALFPGPTVMHVTLYGDPIIESSLTKKIILTDEQYLILCDYVTNSFKKNNENNFILINCCHYSTLNDNFYEGEGDYHLFNTCNNWTNSALKKSGVKTALWAPFDKCIFYHF
jgi:uncharacterized protein (TIGR02117 family)